VREFVRQRPLKGSAIEKCTRGQRRARRQPSPTLRTPALGRRVLFLEASSWVETCFADSPAQTTESAESPNGSAQCSCTRGATSIGVRAAEKPPHPDQPAGPRGCLRPCSLSAQRASALSWGAGVCVRRPKGRPTPLSGHHRFPIFPLCFPLFFVMSQPFQLLLLPMLLVLFKNF